MSALASLAAAAICRERGLALRLNEASRHDELRGLVSGSRQFDGRVGRALDGQRPGHYLTAVSTQ